MPKKRRTTTATGLVVGDKVGVLDTSNGNILTAYVRQHGAGETTVYVERFGNSMTFQGGITRLGRFQLQGRLVD